MKVIISAGGTGGHIYPAISIINKIKELDKNVNILYIGTTNRMEKDIIPNLGIEYLGIKINGLSKNPIKCIKFVTGLLNGIKISPSPFKKRTIVKRYSSGLFLSLKNFKNNGLFNISS